MLDRMKAWTQIDTEFGWIRLDWSSQGLRALHLLGPEPGPEGELDLPPFVQAALARLKAFLEGGPPSFGALSLDLSGQPPFRRRVLEVLRQTRPGQTLSYGELALLAGSPGAARAVGQAMKRNPLPILIPCHRVVGSGWAGGFSFGEGLDTKARLLALDARHTE